MATKKVKMEDVGTKNFLKQELNRELTALESRLDAKIDSVGQSFKEYVDSCLGPIHGDIKGIHGDINAIRVAMKEQGSKMDRYYNGIVKMVEGLIGTGSDHKDRLQNHEDRLTILEAKILA